MARFNNGWVKFYRSVVEGDLKDNAYLLALWSWLLAAATWKETKIMDGGKQRILPPGSVVFGITELAETWDCSKATVSKWAHYLHDTGRIHLEARTRGCIATIRNWDVYQGNEEEVRTQSEREVNTGRTRSEHEANCIEESKKVRTKESKKTTSPTTLAASRAMIAELNVEVPETWIQKLKPELIQGWINTYPDREWIAHQLKSADLWCKANSAKAPKADYARFLNGWLSRGWEKHRQSLPGQPAAKAIDWDKVFA